MRRPCLPPQQRIEHLYLLGLVVRCSYATRRESFGIKPYLEEDYRRALDEALPLLWETMACQHNSRETRELLATAASFKGHPGLAEVLDNLECINQDCPQCGGHVIFDTLLLEEADEGPV